MDPIINGKSDVTQNRTYFRFTPFEGEEFGGRYEGKDSYVQIALAQLTAAGFECEYINDSSPISSVTFKYAGRVNNGFIVAPNNDYQDTWELVRNTVQKELLESDHPLIAAIVNPNFDELKYAFANPGAPVPATVPPASPTPTRPAFTAGNPISVTNCNYLWDLFQSGVRTVPVKQPILKLTRTTNPLYDAPFDMTKIDTVLTTMSMISDSGVPSNFALPLATLANQLIKNHDQASNAARADSLKLGWGWMKELTSSNKHGRKRIQYVLEYQFGLWDTKLYGNPS